MKSALHRSLCLLMTFFCTLPCLGQGFDASSLPRTVEGGNVREFFASNRQKRFLLRVHVWGDVPMAGVYYVPDNSTMLDVLGFAGGPMGLLEDADVTLNRQDEKTKQVVSTSFDGTKLVWDTELRKDVIQEGDVLFIDSPARIDTTARTLQIISLGLGILAAGAAIYSVTRK